MLLKQGGTLALTAAAAPILMRAARAQTTSFDYYISPTGSDSNPGTAAQPWSITALNTKQSVYAGKRVGLLDGTYNVYSLCQAGAWNRPALNVNGGTSSSPTLVGAVNARQAIITAANPAGGGYPTTQCPIIGQGPSGQVANYGNVILDGLYLTRSYQYGIEFYGISTASGEGGSTGIVVRNCEIYDISGLEPNNVGGVLLYYCTGVLVSNNKIHSVQPAAGGDVGGILSFNCRSNIYEYNTIYDCNTGIFDKNGSNGNHTYRYNYIEIAGLYPLFAIQDCAGGSLGDTVTVYNNVLIAPQIWNGSDANVRPNAYQSLVFYNNTCYYGSGGFNSGGVYYPTAGATVSPAATVTSFNNIFYSTGTPGYLGDVTFVATALSISDYNCYQPLTASTSLMGLSTIANPGVPSLLQLSSWQVTTGKDTHSIAAVPGFIAPSSLNPAGYKLPSTSPCKSLGRVGGTSSGAVTEAGAWGNGATQIGCNFGPIPRSPVLSVS
jgi:hypothetical protein